jgi:hypothetical protein
VVYLDLALFLVPKHEILDETSKILLAEDCALADKSGSIQNTVSEHKANSEEKRHDTCRRIPTTGLTKWAWDFSLQRISQQNFRKREGAIYIYIYRERERGETDR